jgi:hypothetical protein
MFRRPHGQKLCFVSKQLNLDTSTGGDGTTCSLFPHTSILKVASLRPEPFNCPAPSNPSAVLSDGLGPSNSSRSHSSFSSVSIFRGLALAFDLFVQANSPATGPLTLLELSSACAYRLHRLLHTASTDFCSDSSSCK